MLIKLITLIRIQLIFNILINKIIININQHFMEKNDVFR